jgi:phosphoribosyl 1,2-cyclic phosphodiesterase
LALRFAMLGSGSRGNALLVETTAVRVLIDCGFPAKEIERRLAALSVDPQTLNGIFITHEHTDHIRGAGAFARRYRLPVWMTDGTFRATEYGELPQLNRLDCHAGWVSLGDLQLQPFPVPHDAREPCQFLLQSAGRRLGLLTDTGHITPHIEQSLSDCDGLILEFNHDPDLLRLGPYPVHLQARVGGRQGHLNNQQAAALLKRMSGHRLQCLVASHLSEKNNHPDKVVQAISAVDSTMTERLHIAEQDEHSPWISIA